METRWWHWLRGPTLALSGAAAWIVAGSPVVLTGPALWWLA